MKRALIGHAPVDSGQLLVTDPAYLVNWRNDDAPGHAPCVDAATGKHYRFGVDFYSYEDKFVGGQFLSLGDPAYPGTVANTVNQMLQAGQWNKTQWPETGEYSYSGCCRATTQHDHIGGSVSQGVAFTTGGDGHFPVYLETNDRGGRRIVIEIG